MDEKMEPIDLYHFTVSPPSRSVLLLARHMGLSVNVKVVNILAGEQMAEEYMKMNPTHTVPTIDDNGYYLWESRAILHYFVDQYGKDDSLSPKDPKKAGIVNQQLFFDATSLTKTLAAFLFPVVLKGEAPDEEKKAAIDGPLKILDDFLGIHKWAAGDELTIADFSMIATVSTIEAIQVDLSKFSNVVNWMGECKKVMVGYEEANQEGANMLGGAFLSKISSV